MWIKILHQVLLGFLFTSLDSCHPHPRSVHDPSSLTKNSLEQSNQKPQAHASGGHSDGFTSNAQQSISPKGPMACSILESEVSTIDLSWIPQDTRTFVLAQTGHKHWEESVRTFERWLRRSENAKHLPLRVKFELSLLRTESEFVHRLLDSIADTSDLLLKIMPPTGQGFWTWYHACDINQLTERMRQQWELEVRQDLKARIGVSTRPDLLPFEVLMLSGGKGIFAPPHSHTSLLSWLEGPTTTSFNSKIEIDVESGLADIRDQLHHSPLIVLSSSHGFLGTSNSRQTTHDPLQIVVRDQEVWFNGARDATFMNP